MILDRKNTNVNIVDKRLAEVYDILDYLKRRFLNKTGPNQTVTANITFEGDVNITENLSINTLTDPRLPYYDGTTLQNTNIYYDAVNGRTGIDEAAPDSTLELNGTLHVIDTVTLDTVINAGIDTDKFLVLDASGNVDYRTGAEVLSDIGAAPALSLTTGYIPYANTATTLSDSIASYDSVNSRIGINEAVPDSTLEVGGAGHFTDTLRIDGLLDANSGADIEGAVNIQSTLTLQTVIDAGIDTNKFLVLDASGNVDYRTGAEVLSDIGAVSGYGSGTANRLAYWSDANTITADTNLYRSATGLGIGTSPDSDCKLHVNDPTDTDGYSLIKLEGSDYHKWISWKGHTLKMGTHDYAHSYVHFGPKGSISGVLRSNIYVHWTDATPTAFNRWNIGASSGDGYIYGYANNGSTINTKISAIGNSYFNVGNVGIGTSTCNYKLTVLNGSDSDDIVRVYGSDLTEEYLAFGCQRNIGSNDEAVITFGNLGITNTDLIFKSWTPAAATEYMRIIGTNGKTVIGSLGAADSRLHVYNASAGAVGAISDTILTVENNDNAYINLLSPSGSEQGIIFGDAADNDIGQVIYDHSDNHMSLVVNAGERMRFNQFGNVGIGTISPSTKLHVDGDITCDAVVHDVSNDLLKISGDTSGDVGGNVIFYGGSHASLPDCVLFRTDTTSNFMIAGTGGLYAYRLSTDTGTDLILSGSNEICKKASARRFKKDIMSSNIDTSVLQKFEIVDFKWKNNEKEDFGFIADDLEKLCPNIATYTGEEIQSWDTQKMLTLAVGEIQRLNKRIDVLEERLTV